MRETIRKFIFLSLSALIVNGSLFGNSILLAKQSTLSPQTDFLFMQYRKISRESPQTKKGLDALFAMGEYYFLMSDFQNAKESFQAFLKDGKNKFQKFFAYAYLLKMAELNHDQQSIKQISKDLAQFRRNIFVFRNTKQYKFNSPLKRSHKIICSIGKVEFIVEEKSFAKLSL